MSGFREFVRMYERLDATTSTKEKGEALADYFRGASSADLAWAVFVLTGRRLRRPLSGYDLRDWAGAFTGLPGWLIEESYDVVGDMGETLSLLCSRGVERNEDEGPSLAAFMETEVVPLASLDAEQQRAIVERWWREFDESTCFVAHKLVTGAFRVGVSATLATRALADAIGQPPQVVAHRLMGSWEPTPAFGDLLRAEEEGRAERSRPYPFYLASQLDGAAASLGDRNEWLAEWKWDGIRAQVIARGGNVYVWSRGEELVTERFPEIAAGARGLPDGTVLDGEIVVLVGDRVQPFSVLQTRIGRKSLSPELLRNSPAFFLAFDILESHGADIRELSLDERRARMVSIMPAGGTIRPSEEIAAPTWDALAELRDGSRARGVEGLMLKRRASAYRSGRPRGDWWKWKVDPYTMDAVLVYAQAGHGKRAALHTDYTFAVWDGDTLVPVAKAYSGLDNDEIARLDAWVRTHTTERWGPVRGVEPVHVFELGFEAIQRSTRHKAGIAVRFPRVLRWRTDKLAREANTIEDLRRLIATAAEENPARKTPPESPPALTLFDGMDLADE